MDLHRIEVFGEIRSDKSSLHFTTLQQERVPAYLGTSRGIYDGLWYHTVVSRRESRTSDPWNKCKFFLRHTLMMILIHKKDSPTQGTLQAIFEVGQTSVCRPILLLRFVTIIFSTTFVLNVSNELAFLL